MRVVNRWRLRFGVIIDHEARQKSSPGAQTSERARGSKPSR